MDNCFIAFGTSLAGLFRYLLIAMVLCVPDISLGQTSGASAAQGLALLRQSTLDCGEQRSGEFTEPSPGRVGERISKSINYRWEVMTVQDSSLVGRIRLKNLLSGDGKNQSATAQEYSFRVRIADLATDVQVMENQAGSGLFSVVAKCTVPGCHQYRNQDLSITNVRADQSADAADRGRQAYAASLDSWVATGRARDGRGDDIWILACGTRQGAETAARGLSALIGGTPGR